MGTENIADLAHGYGMPGEIVDGQDVLAVARAALDAVGRARQGRGPTLIECKTWRYREHGENDPKTSYRDPEEHLRWMEKDPVRLFRGKLVSEGIADEEDLDVIDQKATKEVDEAEAWAYSTDTSPWPDPREAFEGLYAE
jgi:pyruvate dehydrogenase E1 component alpha subunit